MILFFYLLLMEDIQQFNIFYCYQHDDAKILPYSNDYTVSEIKCSNDCMNCCFEQLTTSKKINNKWYIKDINTDNDVWIDESNKNTNLEYKLTKQCNGGFEQQYLFTMLSNNDYNIDNDSNYNILNDEEIECNDLY